MSLYNRYVLPHLLHCACGLKEFRQQRSLVVPGARGRVLEVGAGSGLNLPHYRAEQLSGLVLLEPEEGMRVKLRKALRASGLDAELIGLRGEEIPLEDHSVDTVVITYTMCTIPDLQAALAQVRRVLRPDGRMLFTEHGAAPDADVRRWQDRLNPAWSRIAGGCNMNRHIDEEIRAAGFTLAELNTGYISWPKSLGYNYWGAATPV